MNNIIDKILVGNNIVLLCHNNSDGDAIGSTLSMYHALKKLGKEVEVVIDEPPKKFNYIKGFDEIKKESTKKYDIAIPKDEKTFLAGIHKAICNLYLLENSPITIEQYIKSYDWLAENGYSPSIFNNKGGE